MKVVVLELRTCNACTNQPWLFRFSLSLFQKDKIVFNQKKEIKIKGNK